MLLYSLLTFALLPLTLAVPLDVHRAPVKRSPNPEARAVSPNAYIISIKSGTVDPTNRGRWLNNVLNAANLTMSAEHTNTLKLGWNETLMNGIAGTFNDDVLETLRAQNEVESVEPDYKMSIYATVQQNNAPWGISRLSTGQVSLQGNDPLALQYPYFSDSTAGNGTDIYILDTGIRTTHLEFEGRATFLDSFGPGVPGEDVNGHGTHVAGTAAGKTVGVAKQANIFMIKVVADDGSAATSDIISGINAALTRAAANPNTPAVVNMSLGGPVSAALDSAVSAATAQGLPFCIAAGNDAVNARTSSPARLSQAITVGATDIDDNIASFSNFGSVVDVFAPGDTIISASFQGDDQGAVLSGTSMATPHIAGLSALIMGQTGKLTPAALQTQIKSIALNGLISGIPRGTTNTLAFNDGASTAQAQQAVAALSSQTTTATTTSSNRSSVAAKIIAALRS